MTSTTYNVAGMTCGHCVSAVTGAIAQLEGVIDVAVDLDSGRTTVTSEAPLDAATVRAGVDEAGYQLVL